MPMGDIIKLPGAQLSRKAMHNTLSKVWREAMEYGIGRIEVEGAKQLLTLALRHPKREGAEDDRTYALAKLNHYMMTGPLEDPKQDAERFLVKMQAGTALQKIEERIPMPKGGVSAVDEIREMARELKLVRGSKK